MEYLLELCGIEKIFKTQKHIVSEAGLYKKFKELFSKHGMGTVKSNEYVRASVGGDCIIISDKQGITIQITHNDNQALHRITETHIKELSEKHLVSKDVVKEFVQQYGNAFEHIQSVMSSINETEDVPVVSGLSIGKSKI